MIGRGGVLKLNSTLDPRCSATPKHPYTFKIIASHNRAKLFLLQKKLKSSIKLLSIFVNLSFGSEAGSEHAEALPLGCKVCFFHKTQTLVFYLHLFVPRWYSNAGLSLPPRLSNVCTYVRMYVYIFVCVSSALHGFLKCISWKDVLFWLCWDLCESCGSFGY